MTNQYAAPAANLDQQPSEGSGITSTMLEALRKSKGWVMLIGILLFVGAVFSVLGALMMKFAGGMIGASNAVPRGMMGGMGALYLVIAVIYGALGFYLVKYSRAISRLLADGTSKSMESALQHQQKFWRLAGVIALVFLVMFVLGIAAAVFIPMLMSAR